MIKIKRIRDTMTKRTAGYEHTMTRDRHTFEIGEYETGNHIVTLINNHRARNTTYNNVMKFLERDKTDLMVYVPGNFMCADFASTVHNNAEKAGIRCGYARVHYDNCRYTHALNAFYTTDGGERVGNINGISIFKNDIISFYRKFPETFQTMDLTNHMHALYPTTAIGTCTNKSRAYIKHMLRESIITREKGSKGKRVYKFVNAPHGAASPVVAEFDQDYIKNMRLLEIKTMRET